MTAQEKRPKPIRLTKRRAAALLTAADAGIDSWQATIRELLLHEANDLDAMRQAKELDQLCLVVEDAMQIVHDRFVVKAVKPESNALF